MPAKRLIVIVEDDEKLSRTLRRSFERRDYETLAAANQDELSELLKSHSPGYAVVDLKLSAGSSGLACVQALHEQNPAMRIVVLTGFASIATAVEAIKLGACHYLAKPSNTDDIEAAFGRVGGQVETPVTQQATSLKNLEWERIHETLMETDFNISETARRLGMHRRTLARKLDKRRVR